jgi:hypothetical protein
VAHTFVNQLALGRLPFLSAKIRRGMLGNALLFDTGAPGKKENL